MTAVPEESSALKRLLPLVIAIFSLCLVWLLLSRLENPVALDDGLRHFAMGRLMLTQGSAHAHWGQFFSYGYFAHHTVDPWFLSDIVFMKLVPFGPILALKIFSMLSIAFLLVAFLSAFRVFKTPAATAAVGIGLLMFFEPSFFYRLLVARPYELVTPLAVLVIIGALSKRNALVAVSLLLSVLLSQLFLFPLLIALVAVLWRFACRAWQEALMLLGWILLGVIAGFFLHPEPIAYASYMLDSFVKIPFIPGLQLGTEMNSGIALGIRVFVMFGVLTLLHASLFASGMTRREYVTSGIAYLATLAILFGVFFLRWSRSIDFLWPIQILLLMQILSLRPGLFHATVRRIIPEKFHLKPIIGMLVLLMLLASVFAGVQGRLFSTDDDRALSVYADAFSDVPEASRMLNVDWHLFMPAALVRPDLKFAAGIDPSYTYLDQPKAAALLSSLMLPEFQNVPSTEEARTWLRDILALYPSDYLVFYVGRHTAFVDVLKNQLRLRDLSKSENIAAFDVRTIH